MAQFTHLYQWIVLWTHPGSFPAGRLEYHHYYVSLEQMFFNYSISIIFKNWMKKFFKNNSIVWMHLLLFWSPDKQSSIVLVLWSNLKVLGSHFFVVVVIINIFYMSLLSPEKAYVIFHISQIITFTSMNSARVQIVKCAMYAMCHALLSLEVSTHWNT